MHLIMLAVVVTIVVVMAMAFTRARRVTMMGAALLCLVGLFITPATVIAQTGPAGLSRVGGVFVASQYGKWQGKIFQGNSTTGAASIVLFTATVSLPDGRVIVPYATNAPLIVDSGTNQETVTPTAVSNCTRFAAQYSCTITATFANTHGQSALVSSGTYGLQEALDDANLNGGGIVALDSSWSQGGGTNTIVAAAVTFSNAGIEDDRGGAINIGSQNLSGSCTGTATSSVTLSLLGLGGTVGTCTVTATVTALPGQVMQKAGTVRLLTVASGTAGVGAGSGVFTVYKNGVTTGITCTMGTTTACTDTTHTATFLAGDIIGVAFTTAATETLANVKASVQAY